MSTLGDNTCRPNNIAESSAMATIAQRAQLALSPQLHFARSPRGTAFGPARQPGLFTQRAHAVASAERPLIARAVVTRGATEDVTTRRGAFLADESQSSLMGAGKNTPDSVRSAGGENRFRASPREIRRRPARELKALCIVRLAWRGHQIRLRLVT